MGEASASGEGIEAFGRWLVRERELRSLSRADVIRATKIAPGVVEALESGEEARIPPRAYVVGYLRAYAAAAGLDADEVVLRFQEAAGPAGPAGRAGAPAPATRAGLPLRIALAVGAAAAAAGLWALLRS
jgi:cytoskeletal protein RodZ